MVLYSLTFLFYFPTFFFCMRSLLRAGNPPRTVFNTLSTSRAAGTSTKLFKLLPSRKKYLSRLRNAGIFGGNPGYRRLMAIAFSSKLSKNGCFRTSWHSPSKINRSLKRKLSTLFVSGRRKAQVGMAGSGGTNTTNFGSRTSGSLRASLWDMNGVMQQRSRRWMHGWKHMGLS